jgi:ribulose-5-phosphate 4-epimerase/fuculose-1-phosphate aldolase
MGAQLSHPGVDGARHRDMAHMRRALLREGTYNRGMGKVEPLASVAAAERAARVDLAAAFRLAVRMDLHEGVCNHFTLMLPDGERFLLNAYGLHWSEVTASNLLALDARGNVLAGEGEAEKTAFYIHSRIHFANRKAACVLHTHMPHATALTLLEPGRLEMVEQNALRFADDIAYDDTYNGLVVDEAEGDRVARVLGDKRVLFLANHGVIVVGPSVAEAFDLMYYLERACRLQVLARATGLPLRRVRPDVVRETNRMILAETPKYAGAHFAALKRLLDREEPEYAS